MLSFSETQRFRQWWIYFPIAIGVCFAIFFPYRKVIASTSPASEIPLFILAILSLLLWIWRLDTRYDTAGIHYRVFPFIGWRTILWTNVKKASIQQAYFIGYGIRWDFTTWYYNVSGNEGLQIIKTNGGQLFLGTQRPDELQAFLEAHPTLIAT